MAEITIGLPEKEATPQNAFGKLQKFLDENGKVATHQILGKNTPVLGLQFQESDVWFLSRFSFPDLPPQTQLIKNIVDLTVVQKGAVSSDIEITIDYKGQIKLGETKMKTFKTKQTNQLTVVDPESGRPEKAIIEPFNPLGSWLGLTRDKWQETNKNHWFTTSKQEVTKIVDQIIKAQGTCRLGRKIANETRLSRRGFLALLGLGAKALAFDSLLAHIPGNCFSLSKEFWEQLESAAVGIPTKKLKQELEKNFGLELVGPETGVTEVAYNNKLKITTVDWDGPRLKGLTRVFSELPPNFYLPKKVNGKDYKISVALTNVPFWQYGQSYEGKYQGGFCRCYSVDNQLIVLDKLELGQTYLEQSNTRRTTIHEFTHAYTSPDIQYFIENVFVPSGINAGEEGLWSLFKTEFAPVNPGHEMDATFVDPRPINKIDQKNFIVIDNTFAVRNDFYFMMGRQFFQNALDAYKQKAIDQNGSAPELATGNIYEIGFTTGAPPNIQHKSHLGYGIRNFEEFFSVAAEYYSQGQNEFVKAYTPFIGKEQAEKLYEGMKREIFKGKEY